MFNQNKQVNTITVHQSSITSALRLLNPPNQLQDNTITNLLRDGYSEAWDHASPSQIAPKCRSQGLFQASFYQQWVGQEDPIRLLTFKTAFLVSLESAAGVSELEVLSRADHSNITFSSNYSGARHVSNKMIPKFMPNNALLNTIPDPISFWGIAHIFPRKPERLLCPVRVLGQYISRTQTSADQAGSDCLFVHFKPDTRVFTSHCRLWVSWGSPASVWSVPWGRKTSTD